jgi:hypothetical protein
MRVLVPVGSDSQRYGGDGGMTEQEAKLLLRDLQELCKKHKSDFSELAAAVVA